MKQTEAGRKYRARVIKALAIKPQYYECGICGSWHSAQWNGDCREDGARFAPDELDAKFGPYSWIEVPMPG
jgi:hypothetical protein